MPVTTMGGDEVALTFFSILTTHGSGESESRASCISILYILRCKVATVREAFGTPIVPFGFDDVD